MCKIHTLLKGMENGTTSWKNSLVISLKVKYMYLPYNSVIAIPSLYVHPREIKVCIHTNMCMQLLIAAYL